MLSVLEECTHALAVYQYTLKKPSMRTDIDIDCIPLEVRLENSTGSNKVQTWNQQGEYIEIQDHFEKLLRDSAYVERLMEDAIEAIRTQGCLDTLPKEIHKLIDEKTNEDVLIIQTEQIRSSIQKLKFMIEEEEKKFSEQVEQLNVSLFIAKNRRAKLETTTSIELSYVNAWEKSRREQNCLKRDGSLERRNVCLKQGFVREKNKDCVAAAIELFLQQSVLRNEEQTKHWLDRYEKESSIYENDIQSLRKKINVERENLQSLKFEYESRQKFIDSYLAEKEEVQRQKDHEAHMQRSAIKIQAWWRGVMVRRKLGPYRPEEKKKKKAKAKK